MNEASLENNIREEPVVNKMSESVCIPIKSQDGVFSNLNAKPEIMKVEHVGQYLDKPPSYSQAALNMPPTYQDAIDDLSVIEGMLVDDYEVGSGGIFLAHCLGSVVFHVIGVLLGLLLTRSYAGRYGTLSGLGVLLILYSLTVEENRAISPDIRSSLAIFLFIIGYLIFMASLFMYQRVVEKAKEIFRNNYI